MRFRSDEPEHRLLAEEAPRNELRLQLVRRDPGRRYEPAVDAIPLPGVEAPSRAEEHRTLSRPAKVH